MTRLQRFTLALAASLGTLSGPLWAAPVEGVAESDPHELAVRWTLASLSPQVWPTPAVHTPPAAPAVAARFGALPHGSATDAVPDPGAYALMGLLLLGAGLVGRHLATRRPSSRPPRR